MFLIGLIVGPAAGLLLGDYLFRSRIIDERLGVAFTGLVFLFLVLATFLTQELRVGLGFGLLLGILLSISSPILEAHTN
jgi:hypothetical protein